MQEYRPETYGEKIADQYDDMHGGAVLPTGGIEDAVAFLAELAGDGPALELGIGTGRIALPLAAAGVDVQGLDASPAMVARMRAKPGGDDISVTMGDFADVAVDGSYALVYVVFNTFFAVLSQDDQLRCFANIAERLVPGGAFVMEAFVPDLSRFNREQRVEARRVEVERVFLDVSCHDAATQTVHSQHIQLHADGRVELRPVNLRYAWPSELDLMARLAGLQRRDRFADWNRTPFTSASGFHISVYEKPS